MILQKELSKKPLITVLPGSQQHSAHDNSYNAAKEGLLPNGAGKNKKRGECNKHYSQPKGKQQWREPQ